MKRKILWWVLLVLLLGSFWLEVKWDLDFSSDPNLQRQRAMSPEWQREIQKNNQKQEQDKVNVGVYTKNECLVWMWTDCFKYEEMVWLPIKERDTKSILQDIMLAANYMVGSVLTIVIIYCGLMYIFASWSWKDVSKYKKWLIYAWIWALLVWWAAVIVRVLQYIAKW